MPASSSHTREPSSPRCLHRRGGTARLRARVSCEREREEGERLEHHEAVGESLCASLVQHEHVDDAEENGRCLRLRALRVRQLGALGPRGSERDAQAGLLGTPCPFSAPTLARPPRALGGPARAPCAGLPTVERSRSRRSPPRWLAPTRPRARRHSRCVRGAPRSSRTTALVLAKRCCAAVEPPTGKEDEVRDVGSLSCVTSTSGSVQRSQTHICDERRDGRRCVEVRRLRMLRAQEDERGPSVHSRLPCDGQERRTAIAFSSWLGRDREKQSKKPRQEHCASSRKQAGTDEGGARSCAAPSSKDDRGRNRTDDFGSFWHS